MNVTRIDYAIDILETLQSELEVMSADEIYEVIEEIIHVLIVLEENA